MSIVGLDSIAFAAEDIEAARRFCSDYGLTEVEHGAAGATFEALDGSGVVVRGLDDTSLPAANVGGPTARETIWAVRDAASLQAIGAELSKDRQVRMDADGSLHTIDDDNQAIGFVIDRRRSYEAQFFPHNTPGLPAARPVNERVKFTGKPMARTLGHVVNFSQDPAHSMAFYTDRLGFKITDSYVNNFGAFAKAPGSEDHHNLFFIRRPDSPTCFQHLEFAFGDLQEVMINGSAMSKKGWKTAMGPGRFTLGSNWYWYFATPLGGLFEIAADMDRADDNWEPGVWEFTPEVIGWRMSVTEAPVGIPNNNR